MNENSGAVPAHYASTTRTLLRYAVVMLFVGLLAGVAFQESQKKLDYAAIGAGARLEAILSLALVHGHVLLTGVVLPLVLAGSLFLARKCGGGELSIASLRWLTRVYVPCVTVAVLLMLYKGYHVLLSVRFGERDFDAIDAAYFGGMHGLRNGVYALSHVGMALGLGVFAVALWRSLKRG
ncbi:MAG: hypothetical protein IT453_21575 [Planctomycetes bacterium]|nr:hypothetical protein [Planctomycetota bacterium]